MSDTENQSVNQVVVGDNDTPADPQPVPQSFIEASDHVRAYMQNHNRTHMPLLAAYTLGKQNLFIGLVKPGQTPAPLTREGHFPLPGRVVATYNAAEKHPETPIGVRFTDEDPSDDSVKLHKFYALCDCETMSADAFAYLLDGTLPAGTET